MDAAIAQLPPFIAEPEPNALLRDLSTIHLRPIPGRGGTARWRPSDVVQFTLTNCMILHMRFVLERAVLKRRLARVRGGFGGSGGGGTNGTRPHNSSSNSSLHAAPTAPMITAAQALLRLALNTVRAKDYLREFQIDILDMLLFYALPAAGVLAIEMLQREQMTYQQQQQHQGAMGEMSGETSSSTTFPRSEIVQQLSVSSSSSSYRQFTCC